MRKLSDVTIIELLWEGPYSLEQITREFRNINDYGVYQIYGTHALLGTDALLYIGRAERNLFGERIPAHKDWIDWEPGVIEVFLGRLSGLEQINSDSEWKEMICCAEALLIYFCTPPYNSSGIKTLPSFPPTVLLNYKRFHRLPLVISNIYEATPVWDHRFKPFGLTPS